MKKKMGKNKKERHERGRETEAMEGRGKGNNFINSNPTLYVGDK